MNHSFPVDSPIQVDVHVHGCEIWASAIPTVAVSVQVEEAEQDRLEVSYAAGVLRVREGDGLRGILHRGTHATIIVPPGSSLRARTVSGDLVVEGAWQDLALATQSGDVRVPAHADSLALESASGDLEVEQSPPEATLRSGSGDIRIGSCAGAVNVSVGSGDLSIDSLPCGGGLKSGSGDVLVGHAGGELSASTGSGDLRVEHLVGARLTGRTGSGDIVVGLPVGMPVWTDLRSNSGQVRCDLPPTGAPQEGQEFTEVRLVTASGDITLVPQGASR